jgi:hypothetical protein
MHIFVILLFPLRLITVPIVAPIVDGMIKAVSQLGGPPYYFWSNLLPIAKVWLLWQGGQ